jgi:hypothetical protein
MTQQALKVLERIVALEEESDETGALKTTKKEKRANRLLEFLKPPDVDTQQGWFFYLSLNYNEALDIQWTERKKDKVAYWVWTQGGWFYFKQGDIIYDSPDAYAEWQTKGTRFRYCIQVDSSIGATPATTKAKRKSGSVNFTLFTPDKTATSLIAEGKYSRTQDEFVRFLITGKSSALTLNEKKEAELWKH